MANLFTNFISKILKKITSPDVPTEVQLENRLYLPSRPQSDTRHLEKINSENDFENPQEQERETNCDCEYKNNSARKKQTSKEKLIQYIKNAKAYIANEDIKNASIALNIADRLDRNKEYKSEIRNLKYKIEKVAKKLEADKLATEAQIKLKSGEYQEAIKLYRKANELGFYSKDYRNAITAFEEYKRKKQQEEHKLLEQYKKQAETYYKNAVKDYNNRNYKTALAELNNAIDFARKADIRSNKYVILKNRILADQKSTLNTQNNNISRTKISKSPSTNNKNVNKFEGYGLLDDECDEYIPPSIAEIISKKSTSNSSYNKNNESKDNIAEGISEQQNIARSELEKLIYIAEDFINMQTYKNAQDYIDKARGIITKSDDKKYLGKLELLSEKITLGTFEPVLEKMLHQNDYKSAIKQLKSFIANKPKNQLFDEKLKYVENLYCTYKELEKLYNEAINLYEREDYKTALSTINIALELAKNKDLNIDNFKKLQTKIEAEEIYQRMLKIYESDNICYELIIKNLRKIIGEKYSNERYVNLLEKVVVEYNLIQEENYYKTAQKDFEAETYTSALKNINKALKLNPNNDMYKTLKREINAKQEIIKKDKKFYSYYKKSFIEYNNAQYNEAIRNLEKALELKPENKDCEKLLEKARENKVDIATCTKQALMTLDFINEEIAENIIQARNDGMMWFDYQKFSEQFGIMPHLWADVEARIEFPLKQANKYGRRLDF